MNDALCLQSFMELSTITVPIQDPSSWTRGPWSEDLRLNVRRLWNAWWNSQLTWFCSDIIPTTRPLLFRLTLNPLRCPFGMA